jgi:hypothetical protein
MADRNFKVSPSARCVSAANVICKDTDVFNRDGILLTGILWHCLYLDFLYSSLSVICWFNIKHLTVFRVVFILCFYLLMLFLIIHITWILYYFYCAVVFGCNWPCLAIVKYINKWNKLLLLPHDLTYRIRFSIGRYFCYPSVKAARTRSLILATVAIFSSIISQFLCFSDPVPSASFLVAQPTTSLYRTSSLYRKVTRSNTRRD